MTADTLIKAATIVALVAAAAASPSADWFALGLVLFGSMNVLFSPPGTRWVRTAAIVLSFGALLSRGDLRTLVAVVAWLAWTPAFLLAWGLNRDAIETTATKEPEPSSTGRDARIAVAAIIGAVACASLAYRVILGYGLQQTAALFVGLPALLAILVVFTVSPRSAVGVACKAVTVGLLVSLVFLGEGILCVVMSAPLFYALAIGLALVVSSLRESAGRRHTTLSCVAVLAVIPMSLEGVATVTSLNRDELVTETRIVQASPESVQRAIFERPRFDRPLPGYLRAGFPRPISTRIEKGAAGLRWVIRLRGGEMRLNGMEPRAGDLVLQLEESRPGLVRWQAVSDDSHMTHFLSWREVTVQWEPVGPQSTKVTWTLQYRRGLDPAWYFGPWQRYAARLAAGYLIESVATP